LVIGIFAHRHLGDLQITQIWWLAPFAALAEASGMTPSITIRPFAPRAR
jgi:hypothetical protein